MNKGADIADNTELLHHKYSCISVKQIEYLFFCYMQQYETYTFKDIKKFINSFCYNFYFGNDLTRHLIGYMCDRNSITEIITLKKLEWLDYFNSDINDIRMYSKNKNNISE